MAQIKGKPPELRSKIHGYVFADKIYATTRADNNLEDRLQKGRFTWRDVQKKDDVSKNQVILQKINTRPPNTYFNMSLAYRLFADDRAYMKTSILQNACVTWHMEDDLSFEEAQMVQRVRALSGPGGFFFGRSRRPPSLERLEVLYVHVISGIPSVRERLPSSIDMQPKPHHHMTTNELEETFFNATVWVPGRRRFQKLPLLSPAVQDRKVESVHRVYVPVDFSNLDPTTKLDVNSLREQTRRCSLIKCLLTSDGHVVKYEDQLTTLIPFSDVCSLDPERRPLDLLETIKHTRSVTYDIRFE